MSRRKKRSGRSEFSIDDNVVNVHNMFLNKTALLEHFATHRTLELRQHSALESLMSYHSFLLFVRPATSVQAQELVYRNDKRKYVKARL